MDALLTVYEVMKSIGYYQLSVDLSPNGCMLVSAVSLRRIDSAIASSRLHEPCRHTGLGIDRILGRSICRHSWPAQTDVSTWWFEGAPDRTKDSFLIPSGREREREREFLSISSSSFFFGKLLGK